MTESKRHLSRAERITQQIQQRFTPIVLELRDDSAKHAGHAGANPSGESHFSLRMVSATFEGQNRVARQRLVYETLREEFDTGLHALALDLKTPEEADAS